MLDDARDSLQDDANNDLEKQRLKNVREVHGNISIVQSEQETYVIAVAISLDKTKNFINKINCKRGIPIQGYVYDAQSDSYFLECSDFIHIGIIPASFVATLKNQGGWQMFVPMPESVIKRYMNDAQKKDLKQFKNHFKSDEFVINFVQMVNPN